MHGPERAPRGALLLLLPLAAMAATCTKDPGPVSGPVCSANSVVAARVIERADQLLGGPTARGRLGDVRLENDKLAVVIAQAGASRGYHPYGGVILDADKKREGGALTRSNFGEVILSLDLDVLRAERVEVVGDGGGGCEARVRVTGTLDVMPLFDALLGGLFTRKETQIAWQVDYVLEPGADALRIEHRIQNLATTSVDFGLLGVGFLFGDGATPLLEGYGFASLEGQAAGAYFGAVADEVSYLYGRPDAPVQLIASASGVIAGSLGDPLTLRAREKLSFVHYLVVGEGDLARDQAVWQRLVGGPALTAVQGTVVDEAGAPVAGARVHAVLAEPVSAQRDYVSRTRSDAEGRFALGLAPGRYSLVVATDARAFSEPTLVEVSAQPGAAVTLRISRTGRVRYSIRDEAGALLPVKLTVLADDGLPSLPPRYGEPDQNPGAFRTVFAERGEGELSLPEGGYRVYVSRGGEYEVIERALEVKSDAPASLEGVLVRSVRSPGWLTTDTHVHAQLSPDSPDLYPYKVRAMAAEGLELPVSTEHEAIGDFNPAIRALGLERWIKGIVGSEVTTVNYGHFNAFPLTPDPSLPGNGRIRWSKSAPAETFAAIRANPAAPFIQVNHPRGRAIGAYFSWLGLDRETFVTEVADPVLDFDGIEVMNGCGQGTLGRDTILDWFAFLNRGLRKVGTASSDNHRAARDDLGFPVTYVKMPVDSPAEADVAIARRSFFEGRLVLSCGPFLEAQATREDGARAQVGDLLRASDGRVSVQVRVEAPSWMDVDTLDVVVDGQVALTRPIAAREGPLRADLTIPLELTPGRDAWIAVSVRGDRPHGIWAHRQPSFAVTNPIFVDGDGDDAWRAR
jgi:hypothetical protein